jgi:PAS domain S-box-containing protein
VEPMGRNEALRAGTTDQVWTEEALQDAFQRLRDLESIINKSPAVVFLRRASDAWPVEFVSENVVQFGYAPDEFLSGRVPYSSIVHPDDRERVTSEVAQYTREGRTEYTQEYRIRSSSGKVRWLDDRVCVRRDASGIVTHYQDIVLDITERKRAEEALRRRAEELAALQATVLDMTMQHDLPTLLRNIVERAAGLLDAPSGGLYLCDPDRREVRYVVSYNTLHDYTGTVLKYGEGAAGIVAQTGQPLIIDDYRTWSGRAAVYEQEQPFTGVLSAPLVWQGQVMGVVHVLHNVETRRFTAADLDLLTLFANHAAIAIENARVHDATQREIAERKRAEEVLRESEARLSATFENLPFDFWARDQNGRIVLQNSLCVKLWGDQIGKLAEEAGLDEQALAIWQDNNRRAFAGEVVRGEVEYTLGKERKCFDNIVAPIRVREEIHGILGFNIDITERKRAEEALLARTRQLEAVRVVSTEITRELDLTTLLGLLTRRAAELTGATSGVVSLWDEAAQNLVPRAWHGLGEWMREMLLRLGEGVTGTVAARREGMIVNDFRDSPLALPVFLERTEITAVLAEPLGYRDRLVGVITINNEGSGRSFTQDDQQLLSLFAAQAAIAIENARLYQAAQHDIAERKRAEETLRHEKEVLQTILDNIPVMVACFDREGHYQWVNRSWQSTLGWSLQEALQTDVLAETYPDPEYRKYVVDFIGSAASTWGDFRMRTRGGRVLDTAWANVPLSDGSNIGIGIDITERKRAEEALVKRTQQLEALRTITVDITRELNLTALLELITREAAALAGVGTGAVHLWDEATQRLVTRASLGDGEWRGEVSLGLGEGVVGTVAQRRAGLIVNDYQTSPYAIPLFLERTRTTAILAEPLLYRDRLLGVIAVTNDGTDRRFTDEDGGILRLFAAQAAIAIENAQLHSRTVRRAEELGALLRATRSVMSGLELQGILDRILAEAAQITGCSQVKVLLVDKEAGVLRVGALQGTAMSREDRLPLGEGYSGLVAATGQPLYSDDCPNDPRNAYTRRDRELGIVTYLGLPIKSRQEVLGVLTFNMTEPREYSAEEVTYLTSFADQAAIAIENARLYQQEQERRRQLEAVRAVGEEIIRELDLKSLLDLIHRRAAELVGAVSGTVYFWDEAEGALLPQAWHGVEACIEEKAIRLGEGMVGRVAEQRKGLLVNNYRTSPLANPFFRERTQITAALAEPLLYHDRLVGVISLNHEERGGRFTEEDRNLLRLFAAQAAVAIENARLVDELLRRQRELSALVDASGALTSSLDLDQILHTLVRQAKAISGAGAVRLFMLDEDGRTLRCCVGVGVPADMERDLTVPVGQSFSGEVVTTGQPVSVPDVRGDPRLWYPQHVTEYGLLSYLGLPVKVEDRVFGVLVFNTNAPHVYSEDEITFLSTFARQGAIAIDNARLFEQARVGRERLQTLSRRLVEVQEAERRNIARELHDEIGQVLTGLKLIIEMGLRARPEVLPARLEEARALVSDLMERVRELSLNLRPAMLDDLGLLPALLWQFERYTAQTQIRVSFRHVGLAGRRFTPEVETAVYRILQEALTNVARHAKTGEATVYLWADQDTLTFRVEDRGAGFDPAVVRAKRTSSGLAGMRERARLLDGHLKVESTPGAGTAVRAELPLRPGGTS